MRAAKRNNSVLLAAPSKDVEFEETFAMFPFGIIRIGCKSCYSDCFGCSTSQPESDDLGPESTALVITQLTHSH